MKISSILVLLSLSCVDATQKRLRATSDADNEKEVGLITNHRGLGEYCQSTPLYRYSGASTLISVTGTPFPSQGDVSIANELLPEVVLPNSPKIKAICTLTAADAFASAPFCTLETTIDSSGDRIMSMGTPPALTIMGGTGNFAGAYGTMVTDETFAADTNGNISFGAMINYCLPKLPGGGGGGSTGGGGGGSTGGGGGGTGGNGGGTGGNGGGTGGNPTAPCTDNKNWRTFHGGREKGCNWVSKSSSRCSLMGKLNKDDVPAGKACQLACDKSCR